MSISIGESNNPDRFVSKHLLHVHTADDKEFVVLSGIGIVNFEPDTTPPGDDTLFEWFHDQIRLGVDLRQILPPAKGLAIEQWVVHATVNAFDLQIRPPDNPFGGGWFHYPGVAVDTFALDFITPAVVVVVVADVAVRQAESTLYRVSYHVTLSGMFEDLPIPG